MNHVFITSTKFLAILLAVLLGALTVHAQYTPLAPLPIGEGGATPGTYTLTSYLSGMLKLLIALGGGVAILTAIIGGTQYVAAGINPSAKSDAKERILNSLIGLALVLSSYLILNTINPKLVEFNLMLPKVGAGTGVVTPGGTTVVPGGPAAPEIPVVPAQPDVCTIPDISPLSSEAQIIENGQRVIWVSSDPNVSRNLVALQEEFNKMKHELGLVGASAVENSVYRPYSYQQHLYELYNRWVTMNLRDNTDPACAELKNKISNEFVNHRLQNLVAKPNKCTNSHVRGIGIDVTVTGYEYSAINQLLNSKNINLKWRALPGDRPHFELKTPLYTGCAI